MRMRWIEQVQESSHLGAPQMITSPKRGLNVKRGKTAAAQMRKHGQPSATSAGRPDTHLNLGDSSCAMTRFATRQEWPVFDTTLPVNHKHRIFFPVFAFCLFRFSFAFSFVSCHLEPCPLDSGRTVGSMVCPVTL